MVQRTIKLRWTNSRQPPPIGSQWNQPLGGLTPPIPLATKVVDIENEPEGRGDAKLVDHELENFTSSNTVRANYNCMSPIPFIPQGQPPWRTTSLELEWAGSHPETNDESTSRGPEGWTGRGTLKERVRRTDGGKRGEGKPSRRWEGATRRGEGLRGREKRRGMGGGSDATAAAAAAEGGGVDVCPSR